MSKTLELKVKTKRLRLYKLVTEKARDNIINLFNADPSIKYWMHSDYNLNHSILEDGIFNIMINYEEDIIGFIRFCFNEKMKAMLSYAVIEAYRNNGYMSEAMPEFINTVKDGIISHHEKCIYAETIQDNKLSIKLLEGCGFFKCSEIVSNIGESVGWLTYKKILI